MSSLMRRTVSGVALTLLLGGCATFSKDGGFDSVAQLSEARLGQTVKPVRNSDDAKAVEASIKNLLAKPLNAEDAVQIALLNNRGLQAGYAELGIAEADLVQAGRLQNPRFDFKHITQGADTMIERTFTMSLVNLIMLPQASRLERQRFEAVKLQVANQVLRLAADTRKAYFEAVGAQQSVMYARQVNAAAEAGAELGGRMARVGNWSKLEQDREQVFYADATAALARTEQEAVRAREKLTRLMGLWGSETQFLLPERLPDLPAKPLQVQDAEAYAINNRLDIQAARQQTASLASSLGLTRTTRFINVLDLGYLRNTDSGLPRATGYELSLEIPLFDWGSARVAKAEAIYMQSANHLAETAVNARSEVRESYLGYRSAYDLARHYRDNIVPLRKQISDENMLRYNGMLISVFELLADAREQVLSVNGYINALKDYWVAQTDLTAALGGNLPANLSNKE
ncbi:TolC family protein [Sulfuriferula sp. GW1]|uniref:TolC family protein n=1 Tax=Sulfuriferula sp. GW1 TaxID=3345111 RepID=UPI0039B0F5A1